MTKREFLKYSLLGLGGATLGAIYLRIFSKISDKNISYPEIAEGDELITINSGDDLLKWSKESYYYKKNADGSVECQTCPHYCIVREGKKGICRTKINKGGKLYTIAYGNPCAVHIDPIEKKPFFHFLPQSESYSIATAGCSFRCLNCQNWSISQVGPEQTQNYDLMPDKVVELCLKNKCKSISYTYTEPFAFYEYTYDTSKLAREKGIKNCIVTAGYINETPLRNLCKYIDAVTLDIKSFNNDLYQKLNGGTLQPVLNAIKIIHEEKVWLEVSNLIVPTWTDDLDMIKEMCQWFVKNGLTEVPLHFLRFSPMYKLTHLPYTPVSTLENARKIAVDAGIKYVYIGNVPGNTAENTFCPNCKKMIIERKGFWVLSNNINNGACKFCNQKISGIWK